MRPVLLRRVALGTGALAVLAACPLRAASGRPLWTGVSRRWSPFSAWGPSSLNDDGRYRRRGPPPGRAPGLCRGPASPSCASALGAVACPISGLPEPSRTMRTGGAPPGTTDAAPSTPTSRSRGQTHPSATSPQPAAGVAVSASRYTGSALGASTPGPGQSKTSKTCGARAGGGGRYRSARTIASM